MQGKHGHLSREQKRLALRLHVKGWRLVDIASLTSRTERSLSSCGYFLR